MGNKIMSKPAVSIRKSDYARALSVAEKFNINAKAHPNRKVKAVLKESVAFMQGIMREIKKGNAIETGSVWHGPDEFLSRQKAVELARQKERTDYLTKTVTVVLPQRDVAGLSSIRKAFRLSSDKQAACLALRVYESLAEGLWRGNAFTYANNNAPALNLGQVRNRLFPSKP